MSTLQKEVFDLKPATPGQDDLLITRDVGRQVKEAVCDRLDELAANSVLALDFAGVRFMDVSCADEVVVRVLARLEAGEFPDRFIVLANLADQHRENIAAALTVAKKTVLTEMGKKASVLGELVGNYRDALDAIMASKAITARELQGEMEYNTINEASSKLTFLYQRCLIAREPFREAVRGGGRQFRYLSLLN